MYYHANYTAVGLSDREFVAGGDVGDGPLGI
jgi:hypothetical protein